ncbi:YodC family protein [Rosenbergiella epipactidis]|uniref:YodC family protein n=1 Tax=Rosenbergiella epipactidis TaxID=1544694 RepID=UPI001F4D49AE|nr:DUF2158 domain-containing protein [Rosenbergiella epipactidis]
MSGKFNKGDVVQLASGGPKMTVIGENSMLGGYVCEWFSKEEIKSKVFTEESIKLASDND